MDAILGALSLPDIGQLFPDNDPNWKGADSSIFMEEVSTGCSSTNEREVANLFWLLYIRSYDHKN